MTDKKWQKLITDLSGLVGKSEALRLLVLANISPSTAEKMLRGAYKCAPRQKMIGTLENVLKKAQGEKGAAA